ncbi:hypothetical protein ABZ756_12885 [Mammaliicoccus sciuri]|uniref:Uncharacterized protein n=1 Tax=Sporosarcina newyorkensis TaxID=759851 RepID=A0A1T4Z0V4_9BACL|nr:hypothetical protein [Sporosarcina newyorkensis]SKB07165.1 hypothetical protein SAMN04244570_0321 [Sporosarcina newyorkensis]
MTNTIKEEVKEILEQMIVGRKNIVKGCAELCTLRQEGYEFIYYDFDEFYSQLQHHPLPEQYYQWDKEALDKKLKELEQLKVKVIALSFELLEELK